MRVDVVVVEHSMAGGVRSLALGVLPGACAAPRGALRRVDLLAVAAHVVLGARGDGIHVVGVWSRGEN